jgi:hypothetical protein
MMIEVVFGDDLVGFQDLNALTTTQMMPANMA